MWASEYIVAATAQISDPAKAAEVTRELLTHLEEIKAEAMAAGVDEAMAEAMALTRMGSVEALAASLAETHHSPLPWRHYVALVPLVGLFLANGIYPRGEIIAGLLFLLIACLMPGVAVWRRAGSRLRADMRQKWAWVQRQPLWPAAKVALLGPAGVALCWLALVATTPAPRFIPLLVTLSGLPLPFAARWGEGRYGHSAYFLVLLGVLEGLVGVQLLRLWAGKGSTELDLIMLALYLPMGLLLTRLLAGWTKRRLSIRVVVEKGAHQ